MKLRISCYAEQSAQDPHPQVLHNPTGDFELLESARKTAFEDANKPVIRAHSILIETVDDGSVEERWVRDGESEKFVERKMPPR